MYRTHLPEPRKFGELELQPQGVPVPAPVNAPAPDKRPVWQRLMPLGVVVLMVAMIAIFVSVGGRSLLSMLLTLPMLAMMLVMYSSQMRGGHGTEDVAGEIDEYDLTLRETRKAIHDQGRRMHDLMTLSYPNPADLASLAGTDRMWQADPGEDVGHFVTPEALGKDPNLKYLTANPYLHARVGVGVAPLYPQPERAPDVVPEKLEPTTLVRYQQAMNVLTVVANLPITVSLGEFRAYALRGQDAARLALARAMLMSLAFNHRPDLLNIGVITGDPQTWEWMKWLPHTEDLTRIDPGVGPRLLAWPSVEEFGAWWQELPPGERAHLLVVVDTPDRAVVWPDELPGGADGLTWLVVRYGSDLVSEEKGRVIIGDNGRVSTIQDYDAATSDAVTIAEAEAFARAMYRYRPSGYGEAGIDRDKKPDRVKDFFEILDIADIETHDLVKVWEDNAYTDEMNIPVGYYRKGDEILPEVSYLNLYDENRYGDGPHGLVAGRAGSGKSFFLRAFVLGLVARYGPEKVSLILADFKGGATFLGMANLPHTVATISDLENATELVERLGAVLKGEVARREQFITGDHNLGSIFEYRAEQQKRRDDPQWPPLPDLVVIIDEFGAFIQENKHYMDLLVDIGRRGRSLGLHLVLCSQSITTEHLGRDLLNNMHFRYCLAVDAPTSTTLLKTDAASHIVVRKGGVKGKILRRLPSDAVPVEVVAFNHEARYTRRGAARRRRSNGATGAGAAVVPFELFAGGSSPVVDGEVLEVVEQDTSDQMGALLLEKVSRLRDMKVVDLWKPSLREPVSLSTAAAGIAREHTGLRIRIGDLDAPQKHTRLPWFMDFGGALPHQVIAGGAKSGRTTLLQTLVVAGCVQHGPQRLVFLLADYGAGKLGEVKGSPNVAAYARPGDEATVERILGEIPRLIALRRRAMVERDLSTVDAYLQSKTTDPIPADPYGYVVFAIDGIGGFLGKDPEARRERAALLRPVLDHGAAVGVHLVYTADSMASSTTGNVPYHTMELPGGVQLPATDYTGVKMPGDLKLQLPQKIPADQPGRSLDPVTLLQARTLIPINRAIEPDGTREGMPFFPVRDYGADIRELSAQLAAAFAGETVLPVRPAPDRIPFETVWAMFSSIADPQLPPHRTQLPVGVNIGALSLEVLPHHAQNFLVYGQKRSGKTNALRVVMESVMRQFTPEQAMIMVVDPLRQLLDLRDRLYASGFTPRGRSADASADGTTTAVPPGYATTDTDIADLATMLAGLMAKRRPTDAATGEEIRARTYFTGREVYVFVDNFARLAQGFAGKSVFDEAVGGGESVTRLLASGDDLGVHFIVTDDSGFAERVAAAPFLEALREKQMAPILQLAAPPSSGAPIRQAHHLKPSNWRAGRGRLIVDVEDYTAVQTAYLDSEGMTFGSRRT